MTNPGSTLEFGTSDSVSGEGLDPELPALMITWAAAEPERVGEVALFEVGEGARILGRGEVEGGSDGARIDFYRQRPGSLVKTGPLKSPGISREQLRIRLEGGGLRIDRIGKCAMELEGERSDRCLLKPGQTLLLKGQILLYCTLRPRSLPPLKSASLSVAPSFGAPDVHGIVGESPASWRLREQLAWTAAADEHTLLLGGSGSGKELAARAIHSLSLRSKGPFIARSAATIPESLIDAELFGNVKGYPNPGMPERPGLIGAANGGTLFLDEIGELPQSLQANLLRVLDEGGEYHNLGGSAAKRSDFRLLGATNRSPEALKHDLAARLVLRLSVPGIKERRDDIPFLCRHLLRRAAAKSPEALRRFLSQPADSAPEPQFKASLIEHLLRCEYTTNIRQLDALLWRAMAESPGDAIEWEGERKAQRRAQRASGSTSSRPLAPEPQVMPQDVAVEVQVKEEAEAAPEPSEADVRASLEAHDGNIVRTARALGLSSRYVLYRLMKRYGIDTPPA